jgi:hypothetical protein
MQLANFFRIYLFFTFSTLVKSNKFGGVDADIIEILTLLIN